MKIAPHLKKPFRLDGIYRIDDTPVHVAVREALVNCLSNADYFLSVPVKIELFPDRLVFSNPGTIRLGKKQMLHGGITSPRNKAILNMFNYIGVGERAGSGVPNIYDIWEKENYQEPTVEERSGREGTICTVVTLPLAERDESLAISGKQPEKSPEKSPKTTRAEQIERRVELVLELIMSNPSLSRAEIARTLKITDSQARTAIEKLKERKAIHREGSDTDGKWIVD